MPKFHDIRKNEYPDHDGWYLVLVHVPCDYPRHQKQLEVWWWDSKKKAWAIHPNAENFYAPRDYYLHTWCNNDFLEGVE